jgi:hypothetical protein
MKLFLNEIYAPTPTLGNNIEQNCKHLQTDACVRASIKTNQAKCKRGAVATVLTLLHKIYD